MARIRTIKPGFFMNDELAALGPFAMLFFEGLWIHADCDGRLEDRPVRLKAGILPYFDVDPDAILDSLHDAGFILRYTVDGSDYITVTNFRKHQRITGSEADASSTIPEPVRGNTEETPRKHSGNTQDDRKGREGIGREGIDTESACAKNSSLRPSTEDVATYLAVLGVPNPTAEAEAFCDHYGAQGWKTAAGALIEDWRPKARQWRTRKQTSDSQSRRTNGHGPANYADVIAPSKVRKEPNE